MSDLESILKQEYYGDDSLLYHYTSLSSACKILKSGSLKLSNLTNTNDPLEFVDFSGFASSLPIGKNDDFERILCELRISSERRRNFVRMLCFCKDLFCTSDEWKDEKNQDFADNLLFKGWARSRMWAQYADNHSGVCLVFDKDEFKKCFDSLANNDIEILKDKKIKYTNYIAKLESAMSPKGIQCDYSDFYLESDRKDFLFYKCEDYRDENEYRFCLINRALKSPDEAMFVNYGVSLKAVILGQRFSNCLKLETPDNVEQYQINWKFGRPSLLKIK